MAHKDLINTVGAMLTGSFTRTMDASRLMRLKREKRIVMDFRIMPTTFHMFQSAIRGYVKDKATAGEFSAIRSEHVTALTDMRYLIGGIYDMYGKASIVLTPNKRDVKELMLFTYGASASMAKFDAARCFCFAWDGANNAFKWP